VTHDLYRRIRTAPTIGRLVPTYATLGVLKHVVPLPRLAKWAWKDRHVTRNPDAERRVLVAVDRLRRWFGRDNDCLQSSLLLYRELSRLGANPTLKVGFRRQNERLEGHAWVFLDGRAIPGESSEHVFVSALHFGRGGVLVAEHDDR
jgi:hypothetical protein